MSALDAILAPPVIPDTQSVGYQVARRILEDHPATADMEPMALSSLAQQLVDAIADAADLPAFTQPDEDDLRDRVEELEGRLSEIAALAS